MPIDLTQFNKQAKNKRSENQQFFERLRKQKPNDLDEKTHQLHVTFKHNIFLYKNNVADTLCIYTLVFSEGNYPIIETVNGYEIIINYENQLPE